LPRYQTILASRTSSGDEQPIRNYEYEYEKG
jgi:hypothetical protein